MTLHLGMTVGPVLAVIIVGEISSIYTCTVSEGFLVTLMPINKDYRAFYVDAMTFVIFLSLLLLKRGP